ncbi:MAG: polyprenyl synthetase family protein, partial [Rubrobacteridae bacterium]|nr:polyprenyl synthetase family protein [Rubrobacteridae bacterium]
KELVAIATSANGVLGEASSTILNAGGKRLRPALVLMSGLLGNYDLKRLMPVAVASELIHLASLIHDDVLDNAKVRRGVTTINAKWSDEVAVATGDYLFASAFELLAKFDLRAVDIMIKAAIDLSLGELDQIETAHVSDQSFDDYLKKARRKTAALFSACCNVGSTIAGALNDEAKALTKYGDNLGVAFQIYDDVLDVVGGEATGKAAGVDIRDGTVTVPMLIALQNYGLSSEFAAIIENKAPSDGDVDRAVELMIACGAIDKTKEKAKSYVDKAFDALSVVNDPDVLSVFKGIGEFVIAR